jgi:hypothetical protein
LCYSSITVPFGYVPRNLIDLKQGNIFGLATEDTEMTITEKSYLTSRFRHVYKVFIIVTYTIFLSKIFDIRRLLT